MIREEISEELSSNTYFSVMIDESRDISKKEQLSVVVCYVYKNNIHEEFLDFVWLHNLNAKSLKDSLCTVLRLCSIDPRNCVGQTYDGASVMRVNRGVQQLVREELAPQAVYIRCYNHRLNLIIVDSVRSVRLADSFFSFLEEIYTFMSSHTHHAHEIYLAKQKELFPNKQIRSLKRLSDTRWSCQYLSCKVLLDTFPAVISTLEEISSSQCHAGKRAHVARSLLMNINFAYILCSVMFTHILHKTKLVSDMLQSPSLDLSEAARMVDAVHQELMSAQKKLGIAFGRRQLHCPRHTILRFHLSSKEYINYRGI
ncbi:zinc finger MYM-type protein 1-like [Macrobrachium rosenbergii]|uniref:zinc finger MYM-type protein 1-like n=1 Tax=Macrobrachium rosenbergii TaxID=79674 RepID=UPI0034D6CE4B